MNLSAALSEVLRGCCSISLVMRSVGNVTQFVPNKSRRNRIEVQRFRQGKNKGNSGILQYNSNDFCSNQFSVKAKGLGETPQTRWHINRYSGLCNRQIGTLFGGMHYRAVTKASTRLETEMTKDKGLRNLVKEIL